MSRHFRKTKKKFTSKNHQNNQVYKGGEERKGLRTNHDKAWLLRLKATPGLERNDAENLSLCLSAFITINEEL